MFFRVFTALILLFSTSVLIAEDVFKGEIFPLKFMPDEDYTIAENIPAVFCVNTWAVTEDAKRNLGGGKPVMILELPAFLKLSGACIQTGYAKKLQALPATERKIRRNGMDYIHYEIPFFYSGNWYNMLKVGAPHAYNDFRLFVEARPGSAGKNGMIYWSFRFGEEKVSESKHNVAVLDAVVPPARPAKYFASSIGRSIATDTPFAEMDRKIVDYWKGLSEKASAFSGFWNPKDPYLSGHLVCDMMLGTAKQFIYLIFPEYFEQGVRKWQDMIAAGRIPALINEKGKKESDPRATPVWYLVDDPEGLYEKYLTDGIRLMRKHYPNLRRIYLNYEPGVSGFDPEGLRRFAKVSGLDKVPSREEVSSGRYRKKWFEYMVDLHQKHLEKFGAVLRREWPGIEFWLCTDNLHARGPAIAYWCAVDSRRADKLVDGHQSMPYYSGTPFFDDVKYNIENLRKPFFPLNDPSERSLRFFRNYTPDKLRQNIVASAALGAEGFGLWPDCILSGLYYHRIRDAWAKIAQAEEFYQKGTRADSCVKLKIANSREAEVPDSSGQKIKVVYPDYTPHLRHTVHRLNGELLLTVFNYHETVPLFLHISAPDMPADSVVSEIGGVRYDGADITRGELVKVEPSGVKLIRIGRSTVSGKAADRNQLKLELEKQLARVSGMASLESIAKDGASASWRIPGGSKKIPMLMLKNPAGQQILIDAFGRHGIVYWHNTAGQNLLGTFLLHNQERIQAPYPFVLKKIGVGDGKAAASFEYVFTTQDAGADFELQDLKVVQTFSIRKPNEFTMSWTLSNGSASPVNAGFRVKNEPFREVREASVESEKIVPGPIPANRMLMKAGKQTRFLAALPRSAWNGGPVTVKGVSRTLTFDAPDFDGIYFWYGSSTVSVEFLTDDFILKPGESRTFSIHVKF